MACVHTAYAEHSECLARVNKDIDCFGIYPQLIPLALFWTFHMDLSPLLLTEVSLVVNQVHMLFYELSRHL